jgi:hypothetical protein
MDSDDLVCRGSFGGCAWNGSGARRKDHESGQVQRAVKAVPAPTEKEIADAKANGMVWVNTSLRVYHKEGELYGKTKKGKFMQDRRMEVTSGQTERR